MIVVAICQNHFAIQNPAYSFAKDKGASAPFPILKPIYNYNMLPLNDLSQLAAIDALSNQKPVIIFKHSTRCSISSTALNRFERAYANQNKEELPVYYLDLLNYRPISNEIAVHYQIEHQSPQTLLIHQGKCVHTASHIEINLAEIIVVIKSLKQ